MSGPFAPSCRGIPGATLVLCVALLSFVAGSAAPAAEIQIFCANGLKPIVASLARQFETVSGEHANVSFDEATLLLRRMQAGEHPDVMILMRSALQELAKDGKLLPETIVTVASADALGIAVRAGRTRPDTTTLAGFKDWLLSISSIAVTDPSVGGLASQQFFKVIDQLGLAAQLEPRLILANGVGVSNIELINSGRAEAAVQLAYLLRPVAGIELVPVPKEFQVTVTFAAGVATASNQATAARAFVHFLAGRSAAPTIESAGMHPGTS